MGELSGYRVFIWNDEKILETVGIFNATELYTLKRLTFMLCIK